jgi:hypothetical protein
MATTPDIVPELSELSKPYTLPASDPYRLQTQMGAGVPGVPTKDAQKIDVKSLGKVGSQERLLNIRQQEVDVGQQELEAKRQLAESQQKIAELKSSGQSAITSQEAERAKGIYKSVEDYREKNPAPELTPTKDNIQSLSTLFGLIGVIGMAMGGAGKMSATASLNAMGGMMKGWQQGRADLWKKEVQEFDKNMLSWKSKLDDAMKKAEAAYKILPYNRAEAESKLNEILTSMGSSVLKEQNRLQGFEPTFKNLESLAKDADSAMKESGVDRRHKETIEAQRSLKEFEIELQEKKLLGKMGTAGPQRAIYEATGKYVPSANEAKSIQSAATALRDITDLRQRLKDPEIQAGLLAVPAPLITKLKSLVGQDEAQVRSFVDKELTGSDKTTLFIKDAVLMSFVVEQGLTGSRVPVFTQKIVGPILDPRAYPPKVYDSLLESREKKLTDVFYDNNFDDNDISKISRIQPVGVQTQATPSEQKQKATQEEIKAYADKYFGGDTQKASDELKRKGFL